MSSQQAQPGQQLQVKISDETLKGVYANMAQVGHTSEEFILDFMNIFPPSGVVSSRVILSPAHAKRVAEALKDNIEKYEKQFGPIKAGQGPEHSIGFRTE